MCVVYSDHSLSLWETAFLPSGGLWAAGRQQQQGLAPALGFLEVRWQRPEWSGHPAIPLTEGNLSPLPSEWWIPSPLRIGTEPMQRKGIRWRCRGKTQEMNLGSELTCSSSNWTWNAGTLARALYFCFLSPQCHASACQAPDAGREPCTYKGSLKSLWEMHTLERPRMGFKTDGLRKQAPPGWTAHTALWWFSSLSPSAWQQETACTSFFILFSLSLEKHFLVDILKCFYKELYIFKDWGMPQNIYWVVFK